MKLSVQKLLVATGIAITSTPVLASAQSSSENLLALSKHDHTLAIVDPATLQVKAKVPVGDDPHEVIASDDGHTAYVSNYKFGALHTITVVDLTNATQKTVIDTGVLAGPHGLAFAGGKLWFTSEVAKSIGRVDPATNRIDMVLGTGQDRIHMLWVSPDAQHMIASNVTSGTMSLLDYEPVHAPAGPASAQYKDRKDWTQTIVKVGNGSEGFDISPDGKEIWVANAADSTISVIDRATKRVTTTLNSQTPGGNRLKFTLDGRHVLVSAGPNVVVLDAHTHAVVKQISVGKNSGGIFIEPTGKRAFVANGVDGYIAVIDLTTLTMTTHFNVGPQPDGMAWAVR